MPRVQLIYRRTRPTGNFSIETSFDQMLAAFPNTDSWKIHKFTSSYFSNGIVDRLKAAREVRQLGADLYHVTGDIHFVTLALPGQKTILTIHDCGFMNDHRGLMRRFIWLFWLKWPVDHCRAITSVSEATKADIIKWTGCNPDKIQVIPTIIATHFRRVERAFHVNKPTILHIGLAPNKNFERHVQALEGVNCHLRIIGKLEERHHKLLSAAKIDFSAVYNISEEQMQEEYANADLLLFCSTLEGFGMPILEAQTVGRPVITSNCSSMPEVAGDSACLVDPYSVDSIRSGILKVIHDGNYRQNLIQRGFVNILRFSKETVAGEYLRVYNRVIDYKNLKNDSANYQRT